MNYCAPLPSIARQGSRGFDEFWVVDTGRAMGVLRESSEGSAL